MSFKRTLPLLLLAALGLLVLMGVLHGHPFLQGRPTSSRSAEAREPGTPDPVAGQFLLRALRALEAPTLTALETRLWQRVRMGELAFEAEGRYLLGRDSLFRLELRTQVGNRTGTLLQVCDGRHLWQGMRTEWHGRETVPQRGTSWQEVRRTPVVKAPPAAVSQGKDSPNLEVTDQHRQFHGVYPLLLNLHQQMVWVAREKVLLTGKECHLLTGTWKSDWADRLAPPNKPWPDTVPNQCRLWLDCQTSWPCRVEWLAPARTDETGPQLLAEMELRTPVFNPELSPARCQAEFHFDPGATPVIDPTEPPRLK